MSWKWLSIKICIALLCLHENRSFFLGRIQLFAKHDFDDDAMSIMSLITSEEDPYNRDFSALIQKVKEGDGEWMSAVLGGPLQKLSEEMSSKRSLFDPITITTSTTPPELQLDRKIEEIVVQNSFVVEESGSSTHILYDQNDETWKVTEFSITQSESSPSSPEEVISSWDTEELEEEQFADAAQEPNPDPQQPSSSVEVGQQTVDPNNLTEDDTEFIALRRLGYARTEIVGLKDSVRRLIAVNQVNRPAGPLPKEWQKVSSLPFRPATATKQVQRQQRGQRQQQQPQGSSARATRWAGIYDINSNNNNDDDDEPEIELDPALTEGRERAVEEARAFWPTRDEFKDLLLSESKWRLGLLGNWIAPAVRQETKWRYDAYNSFKTFLEGGFGDTFDVVDEDFDTDEDRTVDGTLHQHGTPPHDTADDDIKAQQPRQQRQQRQQQQSPQQQMMPKKTKQQAPKESTEDLKRRRYDEYLNNKRNELRSTEKALFNGDDSDPDEDLILPEDKDAWFSNQNRKQQQILQSTKKSAISFNFFHGNDDDDVDVDSTDEQIERLITKRANIPNDYTLKKQLPHHLSSSSRTLRTQEEFEAAWKASAQRAKVEDYPLPPATKPQSAPAMQERKPMQEVTRSKTISSQRNQDEQDNSIDSSPTRSRRPRWEETDNV